MPLEQLARRGQWAPIILAFQQGCNQTAVLKSCWITLNIEREGDSLLGGGGGVYQHTVANSGLGFSSKRWKMNILGLPLLAFV